MPLGWGTIEGDTPAVWEAIKALQNRYPSLAKRVMDQATISVTDNLARGADGAFFPRIGSPLIQIRKGLSFENALQTIAHEATHHFDYQRQRDKFNAAANLVNTARRGKNEGLISYELARKLYEDAWHEKRARKVGATAVESVEKAVRSGRLASPIKGAGALKIGLPVLALMAVLGLSGLGNDGGN